MSCYSHGSVVSPTTGAAPQAFTSALSFFAAAQCVISPNPLPEADVRDCEKFDFIIIGAGTAGCVVANRLSENKNIQVLLIEAGDDSPEQSRIPGLSGSVFGTRYNWQYLTTYDGRINKANKNGSINWPRGKMLGGSSNINGMIYNKGRRHDYEQWYKAGNEDWHPDIVDQYFKKAEHYQNQHLLKNQAVNREYGQKGPLIINTFNSTLLVREKVVDSWNELGIPKVIDLNIPGVSRCGITAVTAANGLRQSSEIAYIYPVENRSNLKILKNTLVRKILINNFKRAYGVEVERNERKFNICAGLEVILSAGSINSPQLLMLSGVGSKAHLTSKSIHCKVDSPNVGQNLQDHCSIPIPIYGDGPNKPDEATESSEATISSYNCTGDLASTRLITDVLSFYSSSERLKFPEYQNHFSFYWKNMSSSVYSRFSEVFRYKEPVPSSVAELNNNHSLFLFIFNLLHPESRGHIYLKTNDPHDHPLIYPNYFLSPKDLDSAVKGIKMITKIVHTKYFKSINAFLGRIKWPDCDKFELDSEDYFKCICINMVLSVYHPVGTCKMGLDITTSVVDSHLRVHGVKNLRVIDASIMPKITSGNTNGPTYMIAERGVNLVKEDLNV